MRKITEIYENFPGHFLKYYDGANTSNFYVGARNNLLQCTMVIG
jgi:hypothetical protein